MKILHSKTISRIAFVQYAYQFGSSVSLNDSDKIIAQILNYYNDKELFSDLEQDELSLKIKLNKTFFSDLCNHLREKIKRIDEIIIEILSEDAPFHNLHLTLKAILRCGATELLCFPESPSKVVIDEYVNIASDMLKNNETGFVNSILDKISLELKKNAS